ncbi:MAG: hypothetical protein SWH61_01920 [Thermodesulfobacteriota bacterium]|nr:hypothetical protein [Thermodesulfobacteriota bacterium]
MNNQAPEATINIPVDLYNPGQFFACCGLLELAHRLTRPGNRALGWFENIDSSKPKFLIAAFDEEGPVILEAIIGSLKKCNITTTDPSSKEGPVVLGDPFKITLDWRSPFPQNNLVKTFAGKQNIFEILQSLQNAIPKTFNNNLMNYCDILDKAATAFSIGRAEDAIDAGFSMDVQEGRLLREPPVFLELLALVGMQRFCPQKGENRLGRLYYAWVDPLPAFLAAIAVAQPFTSIFQQGYRFQMYKRDPQGRYKGFAPSRRLTQ